jgi:hypothetical protein
MSAGFVYLLTSVKSPYVKIGGTNSPPVFRMREVNTTPAYSPHGPWELCDFRQVTNWRLVESFLHHSLGDQRVPDAAGARELFNVPPATARRKFEEIDQQFLVAHDDRDLLFGNRDLRLYLLRLLQFAGLPGWLHLQGAWTLSLFPGTGPHGRFFTINIGPHEVAFSTLAAPGEKHPLNYLVVDRLILDFPDAVSWVIDDQGSFRADPYASDIGHATSLQFYSDFPEAEKCFALDGMRRALVAYWSEALLRLQDRGSLSIHARHHKYNVVADLVTEIRTQTWHPERPAQ